jgi:hypothetical protein
MTLLLYFTSIIKKELHTYLKKITFEIFNALIIRYKKLILPEYGKSIHSSFLYSRV